MFVLDSLGPFDLDPCANTSAPTRCAAHGYTIRDDGLNELWFGRVWLNPPYGAEARDWLRRLAMHGNGIALIPPRMGAIWFHDEVLSTFDAMLFLRGRLAFISPETGEPVKGSNVDNVLIAYGAENMVALTRCGLPGKIWYQGLSGPDRDIMVSRL